MKIKVCAYTSDEEGEHHPGEIIDLREGTAREWIKRGWAIARPDLEEPTPKIETAAHTGAPEHALSARGQAKQHPGLKKSDIPKK